MKKYLFIIAFILFAFNAFPDKASAVWYSSSWTYRKSITIDNTKVSGSSDHTNFPVLVDLTDSGLQANAQADADDVLFTSSDGSTKLDHEIELYNSSTGRIVAWVEVPTLDYNDNTVIYMYYGNSGASNQQNITGTWNSGFKGVYHLPNGTTLTANDSTSNANNSTAITGTATTGKLDGAGNFDGTQRVTLPNIAVTSAVTLSAWIYPTGSEDYQRIFAKAYTSNATPYINYALYLNNSTPKKVNGGIAIGSSLKTITSNSTVSTNTWYHVVFVYDGTDMRFYFNGTSDATPISQTGNIDTVSQNTEIGYNTVYSGQHFSGRIDEVRISNVARSADWIATEYNNQSATSTFYTIGTQETDTVAAPPSTILQGQMIIRGQSIIR